MARGPGQSSGEEVPDGGRNARGRRRPETRDRGRPLAAPTRRSSWLRAATASLVVLVACTGGTTTTGRVRSPDTTPSRPATTPSRPPATTPSRPATTAPPTTPRPTPTSIEGIAPHLEMLQQIGALYGNRAAGSLGYDLSADYVSRVLQDLGYEVVFDEFEFPAFEQLSPTTLMVTASAVPVQGGGFRDGEDVKAMLYSAPGTVRAPASFVDFDLEAAPGSFEGAGCESSDFDGFTEGHVAVLRPGPCFRRDQVVNAQEAGAAAVIVSYPGWTAGHVLRPTLIDPSVIEIPALSASNDVGVALYLADSVGGALRGELELEVRTDTVSEVRSTSNVIASSAAGDPGTVILAGGHLDSVIDGPGINDNGSGITALLVAAEAVAEAPLVNQVRFAFWSGEEYGLLGSGHHVEAMSSTDQEAVAAYLNFDMLGSPNFARFVYRDEGAPPGSEAIRSLFVDQLEAQGLASEMLDLAGRSDHGSFIRAGIPVGGLFSGAEGIKTTGQADAYGGTAGDPFDACYHLACDTIENVDQEGLEQMAVAIAAVIETLATSEDPLAG